jgi:hypothetical protein
MLRVKNVVEKKGNAITYVFSDNSVGTLDMTKDGRGFLKFGPSHTLSQEQFLAASTFNAEDNKPNGGWL